MKFKYVNKSDGEMADTPLAANRATATIYINPTLYRKLTAFQKKFWLAHEKGHIVLNTSNEIEADNYAFDSLAGSQFQSLKQMIEAAEGLLDSRNEYHQERIDNLYQRAVEWDKAHPELDKAISNKTQRTMIETNSKNELLTTLGSMMVSATQAGSSATTSGSKVTATATTLSTATIAIIGIIAVLLLKK
jgi:ribosomal protein L16 Arg81 hydroxylase